MSKLSLYIIFLILFLSYSCFLNFDIYFILQSIENKTLNSNNRQDRQRNITNCSSVKPQTSNHCNNINVGWIAIHFSLFIFMHYNVHCYSCLS
jgi:hypothetical protein